MQYSVLWRRGLSDMRAGAAPAYTISHRGNLGTQRIHGRLVSQRFQTAESLLLAIHFVVGVVSKVMFLCLETGCDPWSPRCAGSV